MYSAKGAIYKPLTDISAYSALYLARRQDDPNTHLRAIREMLATTGLPATSKEKAFDSAFAKIVPWPLPQSHGLAACKGKPIARCGNR